MNVFESGERKLIPAVLIYVYRGDKILMVHRKRSDVHEGKWNGLGGKLEADESPLTAAQRELAEESGLALEESQFKGLGVLSFPLFKPKKKEDWLVYVFRVDLPSNDSSPVYQENPEGELHWILESQVMNLSLWPGDEYFLPLMMQKQSFLGTIWYENSVVTRHWMQLI